MLAIKLKLSLNIDVKSCLIGAKGKIYIQVLYLLETPIILSILRQTTTTQEIGQSLISGFAKLFCFKRT